MLYTGIPAATIATTDLDTTSVIELQQFLNATKSLVANGGGDGPERQLQVLLTILELKNSNFLVMTPGSEIVLLTDASSHEEELKSSVIMKANERNVCISFYLSGHGRYWVPYIEISSKTGGTTVNRIDRSAFLTFDEEHDYGQCAEFYKLSDSNRRKRLAFSSSYATEQRCHSFTTSLLTTKLKVYGYTSEDTMIVRDPHEVETHVIDIRGEKTYEKTSPISGRWSVCVKNGTLTISVDTTDKIYSILQYIKPLGVLPTLSFSHSPPTACTLVLF